MNRFLVGIIIAVILVFLVVFMLPSGNQTPSGIQTGPQTEQPEVQPATTSEPQQETQSETPVGSAPGSGLYSSPNVIPQTVTGPQSNTSRPSGFQSLPIPTLIPPGTEGEYTVVLIVQSTQKERVAGASVLAGGSTQQTELSGEAVLAFGSMPQTIVVSHPTFQSSTVTITADEFDATRTLRKEVILGQPGTITGRIMDNFQNPVPQAQVSAQAREGIWVKNYVTNEKGVFIVDSPPDSGLTISSTHPDYTTTDASRAELDPPYPTEIQLTLSLDGYSISGTVLDEENDLGVPDFDVLIESHGNGTPVRKIVRSNANGAYSSGDIPRGVYRVSPAPESREQTGFDQSTVNQYVTVTLHEWDVGNVDILVSRGVSIIGSVVNAQGSPIEGAMVFPDYDPDTVTYSGTDGSFFLNGVFASESNNERRELNLIASHEQHGQGTSEVSFQRNSVPDQVEITILGDEAITGTVVDPQNSPVPDALITLTVPHLSNYQMTTNSDGSGQFTLQVPTSSDVQRDGSTTEYLVRADKEGYAPVNTRISDNQSTVVLTMEYAASIIGRIVDEQSRGVSDVVVSARSPHHGNFEALSGPDGSYQITPLPQGVYDMFASTDRLTGSVYQVSPGAETVDILVRSNEWIVNGPVWDRETEIALNNYTINVEIAPFAAKARPFYEQYEFNTPDGHYRLAFTIPGEYRLLFSAEGYESVVQNVHISPNIGTRPQYIGAALPPIASVGTIQGSYVPSPGTALYGIEILGVDSYPLQSNNFVLNDVPTGIHDLVIYIRSVESNTLVSTGVLSSIVVQADQTTDLGALGPANFNSTLYQPRN